MLSLSTLKNKKNRDNVIWWKQFTQLENDILNRFWFGIILWINQFTYQQQASESQGAEEEEEEGEMVIEEEEEEVEEVKPAKGKKVRAEGFTCSFIHERTQVNKLEQINCCLVVNDW